MRAALLASLGTALGCALALGGASCAHPGHLATVDPAVRDTLLDCATEQANLDGFRNIQDQDVPVDHRWLIRAFETSGSSVKFDALVITVVPSDTGGRPELHVHMYSAVAWGSDYAGSQELAPRQEVVDLARRIVTTCRNGVAARSHRYQRIN